MTVKLPGLNKISQWYRHTAGILNDNLSPAIVLYYYAVPVQLAASAIAGVGFVLYNPKYLLTGHFLWVIWFVIMFYIGFLAANRIAPPVSCILKKGALVLLVVLVFCGITEGIALTAFPWYFAQPAEGNFPKVMNTFERGFGYNDSTALSHQAAENLLQGKNPYAKSNIIAALVRFSPYADRVTPLRAGQFADQFPYPSPERLEQVWQKAVQNTDQLAPEYANNLAYPAGDFLIPAFFLMLGINDIRITYALLIILAVGYVAYSLRSSYRYYFIGVLLMSLELWNSIANGETGSMVFSFLLVAWFLLRRNLWLSVVFMGIAVATKQTAWFFLPFYLIMAYKTTSLMRIVGAAAVISGVFLAFNLPFMISDLSLWFRSVFTPMDRQMFPLGVGIVTLVTGGILDIRSPWIFNEMEFVVMLVLIIWYFRYYKQYACMGPLLAVLPLFFAWRSLWPYFFYTGIIMLALILDEQQLKFQDSKVVAISQN